MNKNLLTFSTLFIILTLATILVFRKYIILGINHSIYYCQSFLGSGLPHIPKEVSFIVTLGEVVLLLVIFFKIINSIVHIRSTQREIKDALKISSKLQTLINGLKLAGKVKLIKSQRPFAFCFGLRRPKIYISSALIKKMTPVEIKAILLHERYHLEKRDSLTLLIGLLTENLFPFFPIVSDMIKSFRIKREINADQAAVAILGNNNSIKSALRKLLTSEIPSMQIRIGFIDSYSIEARILALTKKSYTRKINVFNLFLSAFTFLIFLTIAATPISASEIHQGKTDIILVCLNSQTPQRLFSIPASQPSR